MMNLNVKAMDTRDSQGRGRFFLFNPADHIHPGKVDKNYWFWTNMYYPIIKQVSSFFSSNLIINLIDK